MSRKVDITVNEVVNIPPPGSSSYFFVLTYGATRYRGKTVNGSNPKFQEKASFEFNENFLEAKIEIWGAGDQYLSGNTISLEMFLSVGSETPCDIPLKTQNNRVGGTISLMVYIRKDTQDGSRKWGKSQQSAGYPSMGQPVGAYPQQPSAYPSGGGYPQQGYPQQGYPQQSYPQQGYPAYPPQQYAPQGGYGGYPPAQMAQQQQYAQQQQPQKKGGMKKYMPWLAAGGIGLGAFGLGSALGHSGGYNDGYHDGDDYGGHGGGYDDDYGGGDYGGGDFGGGDF